MSETTAEQGRPASGAYRTPEQEQAVKGRGVAPADELELEAINPLNAHLFRENRWQGYFERLRREDPVHFNELEAAGRYWSVTKYEDIKDLTFPRRRYKVRSGGKRKKITVFHKAQDKIVVCKP